MTNPHNPLDLDPSTLAWLREIKTVSHELILAYRADDFNKLGKLLDRTHTGNCQEIIVSILSELMPNAGMK